MQFYLAPMEGVTDARFRNLYHRLFAPFDKYFTPFLSPTAEHVLTARQLREIDPARCEAWPLTPQLLTRDAGAFVWMAERLAELGYSEVNLNLGCPSGTVVSKGKGSGMLRDPEQLRAFLDEIFAGCPIGISIKTRLGLREPEEFPRLLELYNQYPLTELIIHPRVQAQQYRGGVAREVFLWALRESHAPVCYNGDLFQAEDLPPLLQQAPELDRIMLGRGAVANPGLLAQLRGQPALTPEQLQTFHDGLYEQVRCDLSGERAALYKMREYWSYFATLFPQPHRQLKKIRKAEHFDRYEAAAREILTTQPLNPNGGWGCEETL